MKLFYYLLTLFLSYSFVFADEWSAQDIDRITQDKRFATTKKVAQDLINHYPPEEHVVIGLGRTTGMTGLWAEELSGSKKYFHYVPIENLSEITKLTPEQQSRFWSKVFPSQKSLEGRRVVVHRLLWTGITATKTRESMLKYLAEHGYPLPLDFDFISIDPADFGTTSKGRIRPRLHEISPGQYHDFLEDIDREKTHFRGKRFTDVGAVKAATPQQILQGQGFKENPVSQFIRPQIKTISCEDALSYF